MEFYIHEAWLLDERRFREWLDLFTEDVFLFHAAPVERAPA